MLYFQNLWNNCATGPAAALFNCPSQFMTSLVPKAGELTGQSLIWLGDSIVNLTNNRGCEALTHLAISYYVGKWGYNKFKNSRVIYIQTNGDYGLSTKRNEWSNGVKGLEAMCLAIASFGIASYILVKGKHPVL